MKKTLKPISKSELHVMEVLWTDSPLAATDVNAAIEAKMGWNIKTTKTLLSRLVEKNILTTTRDGRRFLYQPILSKEDYAARSMTQLSEQLFDGSPLPIVLHLARTNSLSKKDREQIAQYLEALENED